jgi:hypothetical protein
MHIFSNPSLLLAGCAALRSVTAACVPDFPAKILSDPRVLEHSAVKDAFERVAGRLAGLYGDAGGEKGTRDGLSFAIVGLCLFRIWCYGDGEGYECGVIVG